MERVFYFSGYRMKVFDWAEEELLGTCTFEPDDAGFAAFEEFLQQAIPLPARMLVDLIEEEFHRDHIPHVNIRDRKQLLDRLMERHFRDRPHVYSRVIGRSSGGRRDDQVLITALTSVDPIKPWLDRIAKAEIFLAGIWSLPLISHKLLRPLRAKDRHTLVISRQIHSSLRNTYFRGGKLLLSRQVRFDKGVWDDDSAEIVADHMERGALEIDSFVVSQRMLEQGEHLNVYCLLPESQTEEVRELIGDTDALKYQFVSIDKLHRAFKLDGVEEHTDRADALFAYICSKEPILRDHYGMHEQKQAFHRHFVDTIITQAEELGMLLFVTAAVLLALNSMQLRQDINGLAMDTNRLQAQYEGAFSNLEDQLASAGTIRDSVLAVEELFGEADNAPHSLFPSLASVLGDPEFAALQLDRLDWQKHSWDQAHQLLDQARTDLRSAENPYQQNYDGYEEDYQDHSSEKMRSAILHLHGSIDRQGMSYTTSVERMRSMVRRLRDLDDITDVLLLKSPVDVRGRTRFSDQLGREPGGAPTEESNNRFELLLLIREESRV